MLVYSSSFADDCCAANFERAVFKSKGVVDFAKRFECFKHSVNGKNPVFKKFKLNTKKPAILLLDAEGGLIHKQQKCINPRAYLKFMKSAASLNAKRVKLRDKYIGMRNEIRAKIDRAEYSHALRDIDRVLKKRSLLTGDVVAMVEGDRKEVEDIGQEIFDRAVALQEDSKLRDALDLFKQVKREFRRIESLKVQATRCSDALTKQMRQAGLLK